MLVVSKNNILWVFTKLLEILAKIISTEIRILKEMREMDKISQDSIL